MGVTTRRRPRIAVIGGGITGAFAAYFLARLDADVTIVERAAIGGGASGANTGGLNPLHGTGIPGRLQKLALESMELHRSSWDEIRRLSRMPVEIGIVSRLHVAMDERDASALEAMRGLHDATPGYAARWMERAELRETQPLVTRDAIGALWTEGNVRVDPKPYVAAVVAAASSMGTAVRQGEARQLTSTGQRVTGVVVDSDHLPCDGLVVATGAWCEEPSSWLAASLPVEPVKGDLVLVETDSPRPVCDISSGSAGVYTTAMDSFWLGGTEDRVGYDATPDSAARERILSGVKRLLPGLGALRVVRHVAGLRPVTPNDMPIVGVPRGWENVCVAVGSGRKGMLLGAGLGLASAELLLRGRTRMSIDAFHPAAGVSGGQAR